MAGRAPHGDRRRDRRRRDLRRSRCRRPGAARARRRPTSALAAGEYAANPGDEPRALRAARGPHRGRQDRGRDRDGRRGAKPRRRLRRGPDHARHRVSRRVPGGGGVESDAGRAAGLPRRGLGRAGRRARGWAPRRIPDERARRPAGARGEAAAAARDRHRPPLGRRLHRAAPVPRPQPDRLPVAPAGHPRGRGAVVGGPSGGRRLPRAARRRRQDRGEAATPAGSPSSSTSRPRRSTPSTTSLSSAPVRPGSPRRSTAPRRGCG